MAIAKHNPENEDANYIVAEGRATAISGWKEPEQ